MHDRHVTRGEPARTGRAARRELAGLVGALGCVGGAGCRPVSPARVPTTSTWQKPTGGRSRGRERDDNGQPQRPDDRDPDRRRRHLGRGVEQAPARHLVLRPRLHDHGRGRERHHLRRRRPGNPRVPRLPDRAADRAVELPRGRLPAAQRRAADRRPARSLGRGDHLPHLHPREHAQAVPRGIPLRRPPDGHPRLGRRRPFDLLPRGQGHLRPRDPPQADHPADREDADPRRRGAPLQRRHALRLPRQLARLPVQLPVDDVEDGRAPLRGQPDSRKGDGRAVHPARRPRAELLDGGACASSAPRTSTPTRPARRPVPPFTARCTAGRTRP